jgi:hypothetical protein
MSKSPVSRHWSVVVIGAIALSTLLTGCNNRSAASGEKITVLDPRGQPSGIFGRRAEQNSFIFAPYNPDTHPTITRDAMVALRMAPRLKSLDNKTIYLVDTGFAGAKEFLEELQLWFAKNMPSVKTVYRAKGGTIFSDNPELWKEIKNKANGVIFGVGG